MVRGSDAEQRGTSVRLAGAVDVESCFRQCQETVVTAFAPARSFQRAETDSRLSQDHNKVLRAPATRSALGVPARTK